MTTLSDAQWVGLTKGGSMTSELVPWDSGYPTAVPTRLATSRLALVSDLDSAPVIGPITGAVIPAPSGSYVRVVKPLLDRVLAAVALVVAAVPMLIIAGAVAATMGRPVLFRQRRVGRDGEVFEVLKFRTMRLDRRSNRLDVIHDRRRTHKSDADPRHTRVGRFLRRYSLDELPQLINVLRGEMSIVGPRPELESVVANYEAALHQRHHVAPGLTGLWQVSARGSGPMHENGQWDLAYVEQVSLRTDLRILAKTPSAMFASASSLVGSSNCKPLMKTMSAVVITSAADGGGSKVWELVPSGTMPTMSAHSPMTLAAIEVIGATVVTTRMVSDDPSAPSEDSSSPHAAATASSATTPEYAATRRTREEEYWRFTAVEASGARHGRRCLARGFGLSPMVRRAQRASIRRLE